MYLLALLLKDAKYSLKEKESLLPEIVRIISFANKSREVDSKN